MARRAKKPLLPQLLWGPQKRSYKRTNQVTVVRVAESAAIQQVTRNDLIFAVAATVVMFAGIAIGATL